MGDAIILGYHRISPAPQQDPLGRDLEVAVPRFTQQMEILARRFSIVPFESLLDWMAKRASPGAKATITFDDGYEDNYTCAFPVLARMGIPATVFLSTDNIEFARPFWTDRLAAYVCRSAGSIVQAPEELGGRLDLISPEDARRGYVRSCAALSGMDDERRERVLDRLGVDAAASKPLTWDQVRRMQRDGITFGAHTRSHPSLPRVSDAAARAEVETSRDLIRARLGAAPAVFAYPFGDVDDRIWPIVEAAGFRGAVTTRPGLCGPHAHRLLLPRLMVDNWPAQVFERRLTGVRFAALVERARAVAGHDVARVRRHAGSDPAPGNSEQ